MLHRIVISHLLAAFILTSCESRDDGGGFHNDPVVGIITIYGPHNGTATNCGPGHRYEEIFVIHVNDGDGNPLQDVAVTTVVDEYLILLELADSLRMTDDSGIVEIEIGCDYFGEGFWFQIVAAGDTETFDLSIMEDIGFPSTGTIDAERDTLFVHGEEIDSMQIRATLRNGFGEAIPGSYVWFSASTGRIDTSAQAFGSYHDTIYWHPPDPAQLDDVFVYARFGYWCHFLHDSIFYDGALRDTTAFIVFPTP